MTRRLAWWAVAASGLLAACGGGNAPEVATFVFRLHGQPASEQFRATTASAATIAAARAQLQLPVTERRLFALGRIRAGDGGVNGHWHWHFAEFELAEVAIELCDGLPSMVEADLPYWLGSVGSFCPWSSYVHAEE